MIVKGGGPPPGSGCSSSESPHLSYPIENAPTEQRQST